MDQPAIQTRDLRMRFGASEVLRGIDLYVPAGQVYGYVGPNGAGKSTTVKVLCGLLRGFEGSVRLSGIDVAASPLEVKRRIGYVPENAVLYEALTALEFLQLMGRLHGVAESTIRERTFEMLGAFDLAERLGSRLGSFSKGIRQRVLLVSALLHDPAVLFLDEPLSGLDVTNTILVKELIRSLAGRGKTVFYCSHIMDVVERVCDKIAVLDRGRIVATGSFDDLAATCPGSSLEGIFSSLTGQGDPRNRVARILAVLDVPGGAT